MPTLRPYLTTYPMSDITSRQMGLHRSIPVQPIDGLVGLTHNTLALSSDIP